MLFLFYILYNKYIYIYMWPHIHFIKNVKKIHVARVVEKNKKQ